MIRDFLMKFVIKVTEDTLRSQEGRYLVASKDLVDLERRQRQIERGEAPFQLYDDLRKKGRI